MDKTHRGQLLVEKEEVTNKITDIKNKINETSKYLLEFITEIQTNPTKVIFTSAPGLIGHYFDENGLKFDWNKLMINEKFGQLMYELKQEHHRLLQLESQLNRQ